MKQFVVLESFYFVNWILLVWPLTCDRSQSLPATFLQVKVSLSEDHSSVLSVYLGERHANVAN